MSATGYKTSDGTDLMEVFNNTVIKGANTFSNPANVLYGNGSNLTGITFPTMLTTDTAQTITIAKTFAGATSGIQLSNCCIQGRNDGFGFTGIPAGFTKQPLGYTIVTNFEEAALNAIIPTSGSQYTHTNMPTMSAGVWIISGTVRIIQGNAAWASPSLLITSYSTPTGGTQVGVTSKYDYFASPTTGLSYDFPVLMFTATDPNGGSQIKPTVSLTYTTVGTTSTYNIFMRAVKIA